jgi:hypothetical protein
MAGPYPPYQGTHPSGGQALSYPDGYAVPPPVLPYPGGRPVPPNPGRRRGRAVAAILLTLAIGAAVVTAAVFAARHKAGVGTMVLTPDNSRQAIQHYLDALSDGDVQTISRNALCGLYDGVRDRRTDDALARLSSEAFQKQFAKADVTSVDAMAFASPNSVQTLFTMRVVPAAGTHRQAGTERQAVAQLLVHGGEILVCSYVQRTAMF